MAVLEHRNELELDDAQVAKLLDVEKELEKRQDEVRPAPGQGPAPRRTRAAETTRARDAAGTTAVPEILRGVAHGLVRHRPGAWTGSSTGAVDVWVNNAGRGIGKKVLELTDEDLDAMVTVNVKSALYGMQAIVPHFQDRGQGHLINVSSFLGRVPLVTFRSAYNAAKAALNSLTANLRMDLRATHRNIHVSLVMPGVVTTEFAKNALGTPIPSAVAPGTNAQTPEEVADRIAELIATPVPEIYTNPAHPELARVYYQDVAAFEAKAASTR